MNRKTAIQGQKMRQIKNILTLYFCKKFIKKQENMHEKIGVYRMKKSGKILIKIEVFRG